MSLPSSKKKKVSMKWFLPHDEELGNESLLKLNNQNYDREKECKKPNEKVKKVI